MTLKDNVRLNKSSIEIQKWIEFQFNDSTSSDISPSDNVDYNLLLDINQMAIENSENDTQELIKNIQMKYQDYAINNSVVDPQMKYFKARELEIKKNILDTKIENYEMKQYLAKLKSKYSEDDDVKKLEKYKHDLFEQYKNNEQQCYKYQEGIFNRNKSILKETKNAQNNLNQLTIYFQGEAMRQVSCLKFKS